MSLCVESSSRLCLHPSHLAHVHPLSIAATSTEASSRSLAVSIKSKDPIPVLTKSYWDLLNLAHLSFCFPFPSPGQISLT